MNILFNRILVEHDTGMHPEDNERLESLVKIPETNITNCPVEDTHR